jgi:hypothetical protein
MTAQSLFHKRGDILVQIWKEKLVVWMIRRLHEVRKEEEKDWHCNKEAHLYYRIQYGTYVKGVGRTNQYLSYHFIFRKKVEWSREVPLDLLNCALFRAFPVS